MSLIISDIIAYVIIGIVVAYHLMTDLFTTFTDSDGVVDYIDAPEMKPDVVPYWRHRVHRALGGQLPYEHFAATSDKGNGCVQGCMGCGGCLFVLIIVGFVLLAVGSAILD